MDNRLTRSVCWLALLCLSAFSPVSVSAENTGSGPHKTIIIEKYGHSYTNIGEMLFTSGKCESAGTYPNKDVFVRAFLYFNKVKGDAIAKKGKKLILPPQYGDFAASLANDYIALAKKESDKVHRLENELSSAQAKLAQADGRLKRAEETLKNIDSAAETQILLMGEKVSVAKKAQQVAEDARKKSQMALADATLGMEKKLAELTAKSEKDAKRIRTAEWTIGKVVWISIALLILSLLLGVSNFRSRRKIKKLQRT